MSPASPSVGAFSVKITGRPKIVIGGPSTPLFNHTGAPPVPTLNAIVASSRNVLILAIHTAVPNELGNIREYIVMMFSHRMVSAACPDSFVTDTAAEFDECK